MNTVQKAFVFIVLVLAVLAATMQLVLFAQRDNWRSQSEKVQAEVEDLRGKLRETEQALQDTEADRATKVLMLESRLEGTVQELDDTKRKLVSELTSKANLELLVETANAKLGIISHNMTAQDDRNKELSTAKDRAEEELAREKSDKQDAQEALTLTQRRIKDYMAKVASLEEQVVEANAEIRELRQKNEVLSRYYPDSELSVKVAPEAEVFGKITSISDDGATVFISVGSDDGVEDGMDIIIYKADGTHVVFVADAKVFEVGADKAAARVIQPVRATIAEGDNVANK